MDFAILFSSSPPTSLPFYLHHRHTTSCSSTRTQTTTKKTNKKRAAPPIFISTNPSHVNLTQLQNLFTACNYSCQRFPNVHSDNLVEPVDPGKLRYALKHSYIVVSVFCKASSFVESEPSSGTDGYDVLSFGREMMERMVPVSERNGELVGFGRAVSDHGLTASLHDIVVLPSLQGIGIGRKIVRRILRSAMFTKGEVYDYFAIVVIRFRDYDNSDHEKVSTGCSLKHVDLETTFSNQLQ